MSSRKCAKAKFIFLVLSLFFAAYSFAQEALIVGIQLNEEPKGEFFIIMTPDQDFLVPEETLKELGLNIKGKEVIVEEKSYISLRSLAPQVTFKYNEKDLTLLLTADPNVLGATSVDFTGKVPADIYYPKNNSVFLNYSLNYSAKEGLEFTDFSAPFETGIRLGDYLLFSNFSYRRLKDDEEFARLFTNIVRDDRESMNRYTLGDFTASTGELGGGTILGGFNLAKNYSLNPHFIRYPGINLEGLVYTPSDVEIWRDGSLLRRERVSPGRFEFLNIPFTTGSGEAVIIIRDAFGVEKRIVVPFYFTSMLLKQGLHEYSYSSGFVRENFGQENTQYEDAAFLMTHKYGITNKLTGGVRAEASNDLVNAGLSADFILKRVGFFNTAVAASFNHENGYAYSVGYSDNTTTGIWWRFTVRGHSRGYSNLTLLPEKDKPRTEFLGSVGYAKQRFGSLSLFYTSSDNFLSEDSKRLSVRYSKPITRDIAFDITASSTHTQETVNEIFFTLRYSFGNNTFGNFSYRTTEDDYSGSVTIQRTPPGRFGIGYRVLAEQDKSATGDHSHSNDAEINYYNKYSVLTGRFRGTDDSENYSLGISGSFGFVNGSVYPGQPITDSFSVIKVGNLEGMEILHSNRPAGSTNSKGEVMIPYLISYFDNRIAVNEKDIPINYNLKKREKHVSPPYRSGSYVEFEVEKVQSFLGKVFITEKGERKPAEFWLLVLKEKDRTYEFPVGRDGEIYLENIPSGAYKASLYKGTQQCDFILTIPESEEMFMDIGEVTCKLN